MIRVAAGILVREGRILICQRRSAGAFPLKWEFPGGKLREGESAEAALERELEEELGIGISPEGIRRLEIVRHRYPGGPEVELHFFQIGSFTGEPAGLAFERIVWEPPGALATYDFLEADRPLVAQIAAGGVLSPA